MLHALIRIFGFAPIAPKRPLSARKKPSTVKPKPVVYPERAPDYDRPVRVSWEEKEARRAAATVTTLGAALRVYARMTGQVGTPPSPQYVAAARRVVGERRWAFLQALTLDRKPTPQLPEPLIGDPAREEGLAYGLDRDVSFKLEVWELVPALEAEAFGLAKRAGQAPAPAIIIPEDIQRRLRELKNLRANLPGQRGGEGRGKAGHGGPAGPAPAQGPTGDPTLDGVLGGEPVPETGDTSEVTEEVAKAVDLAKPGDDEPPAGPGKP